MVTFSFARRALTWRLHKVKDIYSYVLELGMPFGVEMSSDGVIVVVGSYVVEMGLESVLFLVCPTYCLWQCLHCMQ